MAPYYYDRLTNYLSESQPVKLYDSVIRRSFSSTQDLVSRYNPHSSLSVYYPESKSLLRRSRSVDYISTNPFYPVTHAIPDYPMRRDLNRTLNRYDYLRYRYHTLYPTYRFYYGTGLHSLRHYVGYRSYPNYYTIYTYWY
ncbi:hypothetical protein Tsp_02369 [Trichinella spiralis]|uniref:hypothetical protein n=1 Tax=Trichinella spiralis TaxID=6334 RepID=UPI0001EFD09F|nr:hypothetical protein Tsp_02369 [Trichinella spiralis]